MDSEWDTLRLLNRLIISSLLLFGCNPVYAQKQIYTTHDTTNAVDRELENIYKGLRHAQFNVVSSSPVVVGTGTITIDDGQGIFYSSNTYGALFIRSGSQLFYQEFKKK